jgi:hypothetical protein
MKVEICSTNLASSEALYTSKTILLYNSSFETNFLYIACSCKKVKKLQNRRQNRVQKHFPKPSALKPQENKVRSHERDQKDRSHGTR